ncbi:tripartite ATP-independent periplasmic [Citreicella sp. SE45]|nr:tripartite ATP-independent periplasmic [Citreicella sp. SE45]
MSGATPDASPPRGAFGLRAALAVLGGILLMALMGMTVTDVIGRYLFNAPLRGATELTELLLAAVVFLGLPAVALADEHVTVDLVTDRLPRAAQPWRLAAAGLFSAVVLAVVAWRVWVYASQIGGYGGTTTTLAIPIAPLGYFCAVCTGVGALLTAAVPAIALVRHLKGH